MAPEGCYQGERGEVQGAVPYRSAHKSHSGTARGGRAARFGIRSSFRGFLAAASRPGTEAAFKILARAGKARKARKVLSEDQRRAEWRAVDRLRGHVRDELEKELAKYFADLGEKAAARAKGVGARKRLDDEYALSAEQLIDFTDAYDLLKAILDPRLYEALFTGFQSGSFRANFSGAFDENRPGVLSTLELLTGKIRDINAETGTRVTAVVQKGLKGDLSIDEIARDIRAEFVEMSASRARTIAWTNTTAAFEAGQQDAYDQAGVREHSWLSQRDGKVRASHLDADGQVVALGEAFRVGGSLLKHPGDPAGDVSEVANCRCTTSPVMTEEDE